MCGDGINYSGAVTKPAIRPEDALSRLLKSGTDTSISPLVLKLFILAHWSKVSKLAHEIHEEGKLNG